MRKVIELLEEPRRPAVRGPFPALHVSANCPAVRLTDDDIARILAEQEAEAHRALLAGR